MSSANSVRIVVYLICGIMVNVLAILTTFGPPLWSHAILGPVMGPAAMIATTSMAGLGEALLAYLLITSFSGAPSLNLARFLSHVTRSKQVVETAPESKSGSRRHKLLEQLHWAYLPAVIFVSATALGWDIYNADTPKFGVLQPILHALDFFSRQPGEGPILISRHMLPALILVTALASIVPALVIPYFSEFKITGINAWPFHRWWLTTVVLTLCGLSVLLTLAGLIYRSLWLNRAPLPYHFVILVTLGFSIHVSLGMYMGETRAQAKIKREISRGQSGRLIVLS